MEDDGESEVDEPGVEPPVALIECRCRCTPEVMRTRERNRTRGVGRTGLDGGGCDSLLCPSPSSPSMSVSTSPPCSDSSPTMMTDVGVAERGASGSSSMRCSALPGTMHGLGEVPSSASLWSDSKSTSMGELGRSSVMRRVRVAAMGGGGMSTCARASGVVSERSMEGGRPCGSVATCV